MDMETDNIKEDEKSMDEVTLNEQCEVLEDNIEEMNQYDIVEFVEMQPMEQDFEQFQAEHAEGQVSSQDDSGQGLSVEIHIPEDGEPEQEPDQEAESEQDVESEQGAESGQETESYQEVESYQEAESYQEGEPEPEQDAEPEQELEQDQEPEAEPEVEERPTIVQIPSPARTIAPKPVVPKIMASGSSGQQILLIQSPNAQTGQTIRLVSGNSSSASSGSFQLVKRSDGVMQLRQAPSKVVTVTKKIAPAPNNKNVLTKVIVKGGNQQVVMSTPTSESSNTIKILPMTNTAGSTGIKVGSPTKTITFAQAQNMGLLKGNNAKMQVVSTIGKMGVKAPMKILPAPAHGITPIKAGGNQNILIKPAALRPVTKQTLLAAKPSAGSPPVPISTMIKTVKQNVQVPVMKSANSSSTTPTTQVIKIQTGQNTASGQIHQINVPGRGVQYVRLVSNTNSSSAASVTKPNTSFTTKAVLKTTPIKSTIVSIRPALTGTKTFITTKPSPVKTISKLPTTIMTTKQITTSSPSISSPSSTSYKTIQTALSKGNKIQGNRIVISGKNTSNVMISPSQLSQIRGATVLPSGNHMQQLVVIPAQYMQQLQQKAEGDDYDGMMDVDVDDPIEDRMPSIGRPSLKFKQEIKRELSLENLSLVDKRTKDVVEANGIRPRKPCNCTRSQCLKLYCDCFANGEFCNMCNCKDCMNNIENEGERQKAIRSCLDRNPSAFRPKIGKAKDPGLEAIRRHNKGCNCKRSGCLKNYCECFEAKIACSNNCKCIGCRNIEDCLERKRGWSDDIDGLSNKKFASGEDALAWPMRRDPTTNSKWPANFVTPDVIEATCQCLLAQADEAMKSGPNDDKVIDEVLEEFGRCLVQIIECFNKSNEGASEEST